MGKKYVANAFHNRSLIDKNKGGGGGDASIDIVAEETKIGTFLGEDLYRQVFTSAFRDSNYVFSIANLKRVVNVYGKSGSFLLNSNYYKISKSGNNVSIYWADSSFDPPPQSEGCVCVVEYTKNA